MAAIAERYAARVAAGEIESDPGQLFAIGRLARLERELAHYRPPAKSGALGWLMARRPISAPRGVYLFGDVGRGKTMLMDLFFAGAPVTKKRRAHFHEFMADVQARIQDARHRLKTGEISNSDPIAFVAGVIAGETSLLCFDEFIVTDIADAMILGRLFEKLFGLGVVLVATSNVPPAELYKDGLNRALFVPFIHLLEERVEVIELEARTDFRHEKLQDVASWHVPADDGARAAIDLAWRRLAGPEGGTPLELPHLGRAIHVPRAGGGAARFTFRDLCEIPLGASDFVAIARAFHTVIVENIPVIGPERRNEAKRFILLIDTLYDSSVKLIASAAAEPDQLYAGTEGFEAFEFRRTASRLYEMRSAAYLTLPHGRRDTKATGNTAGIVET
ncbi:MAG TPA: cell division protein ZapE [Xanthobacteraceae bacterium]|nr:cell division protein ZapE [Xanthobacteraceae bacterium]